MTYITKIHSHHVTVSEITIDAIPKIMLMNQIYAELRMLNISIYLHTHFPILGMVLLVPIT